MRRLIVNADDFGMTHGINDAVIGLHDAGALTSATLMAASPRFADAVEISRQRPGLGVGCHIVLVDGAPTADPAAIPSLLGPKESGRSAAFRRTPGRFVRDLFRGSILIADIEREATAQIRRMQDAGIRVTHVDTHKHTHMFPAVLDGVARAANACGVAAIRNPFEPGWSIAATPKAGRLRTLQVRMLSRYRETFVRAVRKRGLATTDGSLGVLATGMLDQATIESILDRMPDGTWELVCHPAHMDDDLRAANTRLRESRVVELSALRAIPEILTKRNWPVEKIHFGKLALMDTSATFNPDRASVPAAISRKADGS